ncbi:MAG: hypothetical protein HN348_03645 [Proteobacteria bacterium]|nr:hypothetical protein [Pseudomonadota bacterium]
MAFTVTFPTAGQPPVSARVAEWLTERGEPFEQEGPQILSLRALPVRLLVGDESGPLRAHLEVTPNARLTRVIELLFALSFLAGADVKLVGTGAVTRAELWMRLADEQDRQRVANAIERAGEHGNQDNVINRLWRVIASLRPDRDDRWDLQRKRIVEFREIGEPGGITVEEAAWHTDEPESGEVVALPVEGEYLHTLAWRWLSEAYPGLAEVNRR